MCDVTRKWNREVVPHIGGPQVRTLSDLQNGLGLERALSYHSDNRSCIQAPQGPDLSVYSGWVSWQGWASLSKQHKTALRKPQPPGQSLKVTHILIHEDTVTAIYCHLLSHPGSTQTYIISVTYMANLTQGHEHV